MAEEQMPQTLYKYISWNNEHHRKILTVNKIFFSSAIRFNDPFDSSPDSIRFEDLSEDEILETYQQGLNNIIPNISDKSRRELAEQIKQNDAELYRRIIANTRKRNIDMIYNEVGIFSASKFDDNILMWAHYSNSHTGICIGLDFKKLSEFLISHFHANSLTIARSNVTYRENMPYIKAIPLEDESAEIILTTKAKFWEYEGEWRFICWGKTDVEVTLPDGIISEVVFGCKTSQDHKVEIINHLKMKNTKIKLKEACPNPREFILDLKNISY